MGSAVEVGLCVSWLLGCTALEHFMRYVYHTMHHGIRADLVFFAFLKLKNSATLISVLETILLWQFHQHCV